MQQYELNLRDYWQIIVKRRLVLIITFLIVFLGTILHVRTITPVYQATTTIMIRQYRSVGTLLLELSGGPIGDPMLSYARSISSLPIIEEAVKQLGLAGKDATPEQITEIAGSLQGAVYTEIIQNTNMIMIRVTHQDAELTAKLANKVAEVFIAENLKENSKQARKTKDFIEGQLAEVQKKLENAENTLKEFQKKEVPSGIAIKLQEDLGALETEKNRLSRIYTDIHPDIVRISQQIEELEARLKELPESELNYARFTREVEINNFIYRELRAKLESARIAESEKMEDVSLVEPALPPGSPIGTNKRLNYVLGILIGLMLGLTGAFLVEQLDTSIGTIEDVESYLKLPVLGIIPYLKTKDEKKAGLMQRLWRREFKDKDKYSRLRNQLLVHYSSSSPIFEAYRSLRTNIQTEVFKEKIQRKILLVSSSGPEEGKSITISNLAIAMAQGGLHTLLIDADMRRSSVHKIFGMKNEPGLSNVLRGTIDSKDAIRTFADILISETGFDEALKIPGLDNLNILASGSLPSAPAELLGSQEMATLLHQLREKYDIILIDSPPALAVADALILASKADGVILVYRVGKTARSIIFRTKTQLIESGAQVKGVVLNNISPQIEMQYGYYYHYKYYGKYYTSDEEKAKKNP